MNEFSKDFELVLKMVMEATVLHEKSFNALVLSDEYERYVLTADWCDGAPTVYIMYDNVHGDRYLYEEVKEVSRTEIVRILSVWDKIEEMFGEED